VPIAEPLRHDLQQLEFDRQRRPADGQAGAVGHPENVRVDGDRRLAESGIEDHVGGLAADTGQGLQRCTRRWNLAAMTVEQLPTGGDDVPRLALVEPDAADVRRQAAFAEREHGLWRWCVGKELPGRQVDALVGRLRRQDDGDQQLESAGVLEFGDRIRVGRTQAGEEFVALGLSHHRPLSQRVKPRRQAQSALPGAGPAPPGAPRRGLRPSFSRL
jgi:hypothetical protein